MPNVKDSLNEVLLIIISFGFLTGLSLGYGVKIPSEGDVLLMIYNTLNQTISTNGLGNSQFSSSLSQFGVSIHIIAFLLAIIPVLCAIALFPWGLVLLFDSVIAGYTLGLWITNQSQILMWIGIIAFLLIPIIMSLTVQSKRRQIGDN